MPFVSRSQQRWMFSQEPAMAKRWAAHTPDIKKLPEKKKKDDKSEEKKAFVIAFLAKCASAGITTPTQIAAEAIKLVSVKSAVAGLDTLGSALGGAGGVMALGGALGLAIPAAAGYTGGRLLGAAGNKMDTDDAESLRLRAEANAYRRRAAEARLGSQVRKIVASDPKRYVVLS